MTAASVFCILYISLNSNTTNLFGVETSICQNIIIDFADFGHALPSFNDSIMQHKNPQACIKTISYIFVIKVYTETVNIFFSNIYMNFMWIISSKIQQKNPIIKYSKASALEEQVSISGAYEKQPSSHILNWPDVNRYIHMSPYLWLL